MFLIPPTVKGRILSFSVFEVTLGSASGLIFVFLIPPTVKGRILTFSVFEGTLGSASVRRLLRVHVPKTHYFMDK